MDAADDSPDDRASSPANVDADDDGAAVDATAVANDAAAVAAAAAAVVVAADVAAAAVAADVAVAPVAAAAADTDTGMDIGIGTAATGIGIDIGDWAGVFGAAALPGPAVPYRWDDMYHQKPGLAVCLHVVSNHFVPSFIRYRSSSVFHHAAGAAEQLSLIFLTSSSFASGPTVSLFLFLFFCLFLSFSFIRVLYIYIFCILSNRSAHRLYCSTESIYIYIARQRETEETCDERKKK